MKKKSNVIHPKNCAHGYQTLVDNSLVLYLHSQDYKKKHDSSINPFDKNLNIKWPIKNKIISNRDLKKRSILKMHCRNCKTRIRKSFLKFKDFPLVNNLKTKN